MITVFIIDGVAVMATEQAVRLFEDCAIIGATEFDPEGLPLDGDKYLCFNLDTHCVALAELPASWAPGAYRLQGDTLVLDENSAAWKAHLADEAARFNALVKQYDATVQGRLDSHAASFGYGDPNRPEVSPILHAISYADEPAVRKFQAEGRLFRSWRSRYWAACWPILEAVRDGQRPVPEHAALLTELDGAAPPPTQADVTAEIARLGK